MPNDLQQLILQTHELIASTHRLREQYGAQVKRYIVENAAMHAASKDAIFQSQALLARLSPERQGDSA